MAKLPIPYLLLAVFCVLLWPSVTKANGITGETGNNPAHTLFVTMPVVMDTVPANKPGDKPTPDKEDALIKEVPKARKQERPAAVIPVAVKPVLVKPKVIIKPIIKIH